MWAIIDQYKEKLNLAANHDQRLEGEHAKVSALQAKKEEEEQQLGDEFICQNKISKNR